MDASYAELILPKYSLSMTWTLETILALVISILLGMAVFWLDPKPLAVAALKTVTSH